MDNLSKKDRFIQAFEYLKSTGKIHSQVDLAKAVGSSEATISKAMKGDEKALTKNLLLRINRAFNNVFSLDWLIDGVGSMCCGSIHDINTLYNQGDNNGQQIIGSNEAALAKENEMLKKLLEEKERMIQLLLNK